MTKPALASCTFFLLVAMAALVMAVRASRNPDAPDFPPNPSAPGFLASATISPAHAVHDRLRVGFTSEAGKPGQIQAFLDHNGLRATALAGVLAYREGLSAVDLLVEPRGNHPRQIAGECELFSQVPAGAIVTGVPAYAGGTKGYLYLIDAP